jgi:hypothetical protein
VYCHTIDDGIRLDVVVIIYEEEEDIGAGLPSTYPW